MARETLPFLLVAHNAHASGAGTNVQVGKPAQRPFRSEPVGNLRRQIRLKLALKNRCYKDMRQGIASRRRHVAPALSLC
jgi:hypothetical protein